MSLFQSVLAQLQEKIIKNHTDIEQVARIVSMVLGVTIVSESLLLKKGILTITAPATVKMAIKLKQKALITALFEEGISVTTIR